MTESSPLPLRPYRFYYFGRAVAHAILRLFTRYQAEGRENVPETGGVILAPNHTSYADPPLVGCPLRRRVWFMAKAQLFDVPGMRQLVTWLGTFPVTRGAPDRRAMRVALSLLEHGEVLCIFPEGGRSPDGSLRPAERGFSFLAAKARVPIVPVGITGARDFLTPGSPLPKFAKVRVRYGRPLPPPEDPQDKAALDATGRAVMEAIACLLGVQPPEAQA